MEESRSSQIRRRNFLARSSALAAASLLGFPSVHAAEPQLETTTIRLIADPVVPLLCYAPQYIAEELLHLEGFTDVRYVPDAASGPGVRTLVAGDADISAATHADLIVTIDKAKPIVVLGGLHAGCFELFANDGIQTVRDLRGKRVAVSSIAGPDYNFISSIVAYIGLVPSNDIEWVVVHPHDWGQMLAERKVDAIGAFPPMSYALHAKQIGHVILNTTTDRPWRNYFCCMIAARKEFVRNNPVATKRAMRALIKSSELCSMEPERMARLLVDKGYESRYDYALKTLQDIPYSAWRLYNPKDTLRFLALRLRQAGMIESTPQQIIERGSNFSFLDEIKRELKV
jgi:NitT/TauT family transport system substrate-binding protein